MTTRTRHPLRRAALVATTALAAVALLAGCAGGAASQASAGSDEPKEGGDLTFLIDSLGATWIPNSSSISSYQGHVWGHLTDKLIYVDGDGELSPWVAESWEQNDAATQTIADGWDAVAG